MKIYINIFLTLLMPLSVLFTAVAVVYYSMDFVFSKAIKLGIVTGVLSSILLAFFLAAAILLLRKTQVTKPKVRTKTSFNANNIPKILTIPQEDFDANIIKSKTIEKKLILLMDKELAYEVSLQSMHDQNVGEIIYQNKDKGLILLKEDRKEFKINVSILTKHTAEIIITSTLNHHFIKQVVSLIKNKEHAFLTY